MYLKYLFSILMLLTFSLKIFSQDFSIERIEIQDDDPPYIIPNTILIDTDGSLWYTTMNYLVKDYGNHQIKHKVNTKESLTSAKLFQSSKGLLYVNVNGKVYVFNPETGDSFLLYNKLKELEKILVIDLKEDNKNGIWILTNTKKIYNYDVNGKLSMFKINGIIEENLSDTKIFFYNSKIYLKNQFNLFSLKENVKEFFIVSKQIEKTKSTTLIDNGVFLKKNTSGNYNYKGTKMKYTFIPELEAQKIEILGRDIEVVSDKKIRLKGYTIDFVSKQNNEILFYSFLKDKKELVLVTSIKLTKFIDQFIIDNYNNLWIAAQYNLFKINLNKSNFDQIVLKNNDGSTISVYGVAIDSCKNIYTTTRKSLIKIDEHSKKNKLFEIIDDSKYINHLKNISLENDSILWINDFGRKLFKYNYHTKQKSLYMLPVASGERLNIAKYYNREELLLGGTFGLLLFNISKGTFNKLNPRFNINKIIVDDLIINNNKKIWIGTNNGLYVFDLTTETTQHYHSKNELNKISNNHIYTIKISNNEVWIGSQKGLDILNIKSNKITHYNTENGLPDNRVVSMIETTEDFWLGTFNGLTRFNKTSKKISNYFEKDGLTFNEFNRRANFKYNDSLLIFGGVNGLVKFNPYQIKELNNPSIVKLTKATFYNKREGFLEDKKYNLSELKNINIPFYNNYVSLSFATPNSRKNKIVYKLSEKASSWIQANEKGEINLTELSEGVHTLKVKSSSNIKSGTKDILTYKITVSKIFYKQKLFQFIAVISFSILLCIYLIRYFKRRDKVNKLNLRIKQLSDKAYIAQMNPHFMFNIINNIQSFLFLKSEEYVSNFISSFARLLRFTIENSQSEKITLKKEIIYLKSYLKLEKLRDNLDIDISFEIDEKLDLEVITIPPMLFQPIIENAIKHGLKNKKGDKKLSIAFKKDKNTLIGSIKDNGIGIEASINKNNLYKSYGTDILNERIKIFNTINKSDIKISTTSNNTGTEVSIKIPLFLNPKNKLNA